MYQAMTVDLLGTARPRDEQLAIDIAWACVQEPVWHPSAGKQAGVWLRKLALVRVVPGTRWRRHRVETTSRGRHRENVRSLPESCEERRHNVRRTTALEEFTAIFKKTIREEPNT